ncbi:MAG: hypothetical protein LCI03_20445, partial [Actinobacteria bacterium]|nr:hypothetical protein [Actinomycetota bacterium]
MTRSRVAALLLAVIAVVGSPSCNCGAYDRRYEVICDALCDWRDPDSGAPGGGGIASTGGGAAGGIAGGGVARAGGAGGGVGVLDGGVARVDAGTILDAGCLASKAVCTQGGTPCCGGALCLSLSPGVEDAICRGAGTTCYGFEGVSCILDS